MTLLVKGLEINVHSSIMALEFVDGRLADALHECPDFVKKNTPFS